MTPLKNVGLTDQSSERRAGNSNLTGPSAYRESIYKRNQATVFWILLWWIILNWCGHAYPC